MSKNTDSTTTVIRFQVGQVVNREFVWTADEEILITSGKPVNQRQAVAIVAALYPMDTCQEIEVEVI